jgi:hypothetical protein
MTPKTQSATDLSYSFSQTYHGLGPDPILSFSRTQAAVSLIFHASRLFGGAFSRKPISVEGQPTFS